MAANVEVQWPVEAAREGGAPRVGGRRRRGRAVRRGERVHVLATAPVKRGRKVAPGAAARDRAQPKPHRRLPALQRVPVQVSFLGRGASLSSC